MDNSTANNSTLLGVLSGKDTVKFEVTVNQKTLVYVGLTVFAAVLIATAAAIFITRKLS